jgi:uncharacterized cupin superfamily protein
MVPEASLERTPNGSVPAGEGWFVLNAREARWIDRKGCGFSTRFEGDSHFPQVGVSLFVLPPGEPMAMYHWEADQEDFLVLSGEGVLVIEGEERPLRQWDFVHCPAGTDHVIVASPDGPCAVLAVGARMASTGKDWGAYPVDATAQRHGAGVERETAEPREAYARFGQREPMPYRDGFLPDLSAGSARRPSA